MKIGRITDISTKDIPGRASMVIFTIGCNLRCKFCHNKHLLDLQNGKEVSVDKLIRIIKSNQLVNSISISGGEPTLQNDLLPLVKKIKSLNRENLEKYISVDTNGSNPKILKNLIPFLDRVALDIKGPLNENRYQEITNSNIKLGNIKESFFLLNSQKDLDFEIRTTFVKNLLNSSDINNLIKFLIKNDFDGTFVLQQYQFSEGVGEEYKDIFSQPEHSELIKILKPFSKENRKNSFKFEIYIRDDIIGYMELTKILEKII